MKTTKSKLINRISIDIPFSAIYMRLGERRSTEVELSQRKKIDGVIRDAYYQCELKACFQRLDGISFEGEKLLVDHQLLWQGTSFSQLFQNCRSLYLMAVTVGNQIVETRDQLMKQDELFQSVIYDAVGSEVVESGAQWVHNFIDESLSAGGEALMKRRYSPGYGDLSLIAQQDFKKMLPLEKIGIEVNDRNILIPEKSITAILGVVPH